MKRVCGWDVKVQGRLIRMAWLEGDKYKFPDEPETILKGFVGWTRESTCLLSCRDCLET